MSYAASIRPPVTRPSKAVSSANTVAVLAIVAAVFGAMICVMPVVALYIIYQIRDGIRNWRVTEWGYVLIECAFALFAVGNTFVFHLHPAMLIIGYLVAGVALTVVTLKAVMTPRDRRHTQH